MLTPPPATSELRQLTRLFRALPAADRHSLLAFAEFLATRQQGRPPELAAMPIPAPLPAPLPLPRPPGESAIAAIRRLTRTYPMLERSALLNETSALMSAHLLQGQGAAPTIDALEALFARHYEALRARQPGAGPDPTESP